jgi:hypothetical protein
MGGPLPPRLAAAALLLLGPAAAAAPATPDHARRVLQAKPAVDPANSCRWPHDGECDEPLHCAAGTDSADCAEQNAEAASVLSTAPAEITLRGLCHEELNGAYARMPDLLNGKAHWAQAACRSGCIGGVGQLYWTDSSAVGGGSWLIDDDLDGNHGGYRALTLSTAAAPPDAAGWREFCGTVLGCGSAGFCDGHWGPRVVTVEESFMSSSCGALATAALELPACIAAAADLAAAAAPTAGGGSCAVVLPAGGAAPGPATCPLLCAEPLLAAQARCGAEPAVFAAAAPIGLLTACAAAASAVVAGAARTMAVDLDGSCYEQLGGAYTLLPLPRNGAPQWVGATGAGLYWDPSYRSVGLPLVQTWVLGEDNLRYNGPAEGLPLGAAPWIEICQESHGASYDVGFSVRGTVTLEPAAPAPGECAADLGALAQALPAACCGAKDGASCGASAAPAACEVDCAAAWAPFAARCPAAAAGLPKALRKFFGGACASAGAALAALPQATKTAAAGGHVDFTFVTAGGVHYVCDARAAEVHARIVIYVLPPGTDAVGEAVAQLTLDGRGMGLAFTARGSGQYTLGVVFRRGGGAVIASVAAVGTELKRARALDASGAPRALTVACYFKVCQLAYDNAGLRDGDGSAATVRLDAAMATAYAVEVALAPGEAGGVQVSATFFDSAAAAGAAGFPATLAGPLGAWRATPRGHSSIFAHAGCAEGDYVCMAEGGNPFGRFRAYAGGKFGARLTGTWVAAAAGPVLLELAMNCDVPVYGDIGYDGCEFDSGILTDGSVRCREHGRESAGVLPGHGDGTYGSDCAAALTLAVTAGAYFEPAAAAGGGGLVAGPATREAELEVGRAELEAVAATMFAASPGGFAAPPTLEEMLVGGTEAGALLATMFTREQQPHLAFPLDFEGLAPSKPGGQDEKGGGRRRQLQSEGPKSQGEVVFSGVRVSLKANAPTELEAQSAVMGLVAMSSGGGRRLQSEVAGLPVGAACVGPAKTAQAEFGKAEIEALVADMFADRVGGAETAYATSSGGRRRQQSTGPHSQGEATHVFRPSLQCITAAEAATHDDSEAAEGGGRRLQSAGPGSQGEVARVFRPTLEEMLVVGSPEQACLAGIFVAEQQPHRTSLVGVEPLLAASGGGANGNPSCWSGAYTAARCCDTSNGLAGDATCWAGAYDFAFCCGGGHRRAQSHEPASQGELAAGVRLTLRATAPTPAEAEARPAAAGCSLPSAHVSFQPLGTSNLMSWSEVGALAGCARGDVCRPLGPPPPHEQRRVLLAPNDLARTVQQQRAG